MNTLKKDWTPDLSISHVIQVHTASPPTHDPQPGPQLRLHPSLTRPSCSTQVIRCLLIVPFPESSLNDEAGKLFMESYDDYASRASLWTRVHASAACSDTEDMEACSADDTPVKSMFVVSAAQAHI